MKFYFVLISALTPVAVALWYIFKKDSVQPEPAKWLAKAFVYGVLSALLSFVFSTPASLIFNLELNINAYTSVIKSFTGAFVIAAIPEEFAKFIMLWLLLRKNPFYDEKFDGIVYAACIGMGFAGLENVIYLFQGIEDGSWVGIGIGRALFSIPGHLFFAILMGYYYSIYHFGVDKSVKAKTMILIAPIMAHGIYDGILFCLNINEGLAVVGVFLFLYFFNNLRKRAKERINSLINQ